MARFDRPFANAPTGTFRRHAKFTPHQGTGPFRYKALKQFAAALKIVGKSFQETMLLERMERMG